MPAVPAADATPVVPVAASTASAVPESSASTATPTPIPITAVTPAPISVSVSSATQDDVVANPIPAAIADAPAIPGTPDSEVDGEHLGAASIVLVKPT